MSCTPKTPTGAAAPPRADQQKPHTESIRPEDHGEHRQASAGAGRVCYCEGGETERFGQGLPVNGLVPTERQ